MLLFQIQMSKIKTFLMASQPEECSYYVLKILVNLSLTVFLKKDLLNKESVLLSMRLWFFGGSLGLRYLHCHLHHSTCEFDKFL